MNRFRVIVLEGPDGGGKTTLARAIAHELGYAVRHEGPPPVDREELFEYYVGRLTGHLASTFMEPGLVLDRFALGERVYGAILRDHDRLGPRGWRRVRDVLDTTGALRVLCLPPRDVCLKAWAAGRIAKGELFAEEGTFHRTYTAWLELRGDSGQVVHDWTREGAQETLLRLIRG